MSNQKPRRGRGEGSVEELPSGKFRAILSAGRTASGKRRRMTHTAKTKKDALAWLRARQAEANKGELADSQGLSLSDWLDRWLIAHKTRVSDSSWRSHDEHIRLHIKPNIQDLQLSSLRPLHIIDLYKSLEQKKVSRATQGKIGGTLSQALREAVRLGLLASNPAAAVKRPKAVKPELSVWTAEEARTFLKANESDEFYPLYALAIDSGMRQGEIFALHWSEVDLNGGEVRVARALAVVDHKPTIKETPKTKAGRRRITLASSTVDALRSIKHRKGLVFRDTRGGLLRRSGFRSRVFLPAVKRAEVPDIRFHDLRHTCATLLLLAGINVKAVSARLGHSSIQITLDTYAHWLPEMDAQAAEAMQSTLYAK